MSTPQTSAIPLAEYHSSLAFRSDKRENVVMTS